MARAAVAHYELTTCPIVSKLAEISPQKAEETIHTLLLDVLGNFLW